MEKIVTYVFEKQADATTIEYSEVANRLFELRFLASNGAELLWTELVGLVKLAQQHKQNYIILSMGMAGLNSIINADLLLEAIADAAELHTKLLIGNTTAADATLIPLTDHLFWTDSVSGFEFLVIYNSCFDLIINEDFPFYHSVSECLEALTSNKMLIYPMINATANAERLKVQLRMDRLMRVGIYLQQNKIL